MRPHQMGATYSSGMVSMCHNLAENSSTVADRGERHVKFCNQVKFDNGIPADSGRNQVMFESFHTTGSSSPQVRFDSGTFLARPKDGGALSARYMLEIYSTVAAQGVTTFLGARIPVPTNLNLTSWAQLAVT